MYTLENDGASTDPWGRPFFNIRFRLTWGVIDLPLPEDELALPVAE